MKGTRGLGRVYGRKRGAAPAPGEPDARRTVWWVEYWHRGKQYRETSGSEVRADAGRLLKQRLREIGAGTFAPRAEQVTFNDLAALLANDYAAQGRLSLDSAKRGIAHLRGFFGETRAVDITIDKGDAYIAARLAGEVGAVDDEGRCSPPTKAARATVQREVALLGRMFALAERASKVTHRPRFTRLKVENTRTESFTDDELGRVLDVLTHGRPATAMSRAVKAQPDLVAPIVFAAVTGWRIASDVLPLRWPQVDLNAGTATRLSRGTSKAPEHVVFPFEAVPRLAAVMREQRAATTALERATSSVVPWVFHRGGKPMFNREANGRTKPNGALLRAWRAACRCAGVPGRRLHDLRRTGSRDLRALGMGDRDIAELVGWKNTAMVERYLGRDPHGVGDRLRAKLAEASRTFPAPRAAEQERR